MFHTDEMPFITQMPRFTNKNEKKTKRKTYFSFIIFGLYEFYTYLTLTEQQFIYNDIMGHEKRDLVCVREGQHRAGGQIGTVKLVEKENKGKMMMNKK